MGHFYAACVCVHWVWEGVIKIAVHSLLRWSSPPTMVVSSNFLHGEKKKTVSFASRIWRAVFSQCSNPLIVGRSRQRGRQVCNSIILTDRHTHTATHTRNPDMIRSGSGDWNGPYWSAWPASRNDPGVTALSHCSGHFVCPTRYPSLV